MALNVKGLTMEQQLALLKKLLPEKYFVPLAALLESNKVKMETKFFNISFHWGKGQVIASNFPLSTVSMQSIAQEDPALDLSKGVMLSLYSELQEELPNSLPKVASTDEESAKALAKAAPKPAATSAAAIKASVSETIKHKTLGDLLMSPEAQAAAEKAQAVLKSATPTISVKYQPPIVALKEATVLGQRVKGTSPDSKYYLIARNDGVRIAMRNLRSQHKVSFRVEFAGLPKMDVIDKLKKAKLAGQKGSEGLYMSLHLGLFDTNAEPIPLGRVVGSFLMGLGLQFDQMIMNADDIPEDK